MDTELAEPVEASYARFREQTFFVDECLDLLASIREDPDRLRDFEQRGYRAVWLEDILHQLEVLEKMTNVLLRWDELDE